MVKTILKSLFGLFLIFVVLFFIFYQPDVPLDKLKIKYTDDHSKFIEIAGVNVHYKIEGKGHPLVLIHGTGASLHTWDEWTSVLKDSFEIIRMDLPAFGLTGPNKTGDYSIDFYIDFLHQFFQKINIDTFYLVGNSLGGRIAWNYAHTFPQQAKKLILIDASGVPNDRDPPAVFKLAKNPIAAFFLRNILPKSFINKNLKEVYFDDAKITDELIERYHSMALRAGNRQAFIDRAKTVYKEESYKLTEIKCHTLIMWGKHDVWIPLEDAHFFDKKIPDSILKIYDDAGHVPMEEIGKTTAIDALHFLQD